MKLEPINPVVGNKLFRATKLQSVLEEFANSNQAAVHLIFDEGEYKNVKSAHSSFRVAIKRMNYPIAVRTLNGELYLIKLITKDVKV